MTRKEQIRKAAFKFSMDYTGGEPCQGMDENIFIAGAEWADKNPIKAFQFLATSGSLPEAIYEIRNTHVLQNRLVQVHKALDLAKDILKQYSEIDRWYLDEGAGVFSGGNDRQIFDSELAENSLEEINKILKFE